tara:strand:- start:92 stop:325 length:234 start_codon:yes stop_codon:yes gene_type:complete
MNLSIKHYILFIVLITIFFIQFITLKKNNQLKKVEEELNNQSDKIKSCIDIENKNERSIYENIKLSEYCIDNFGTSK